MEIENRQQELPYARLTDRRATAVLLREVTAGLARDPGAFVVVLGDQEGYPYQVIVVDLADLPGMAPAQPQDVLIGALDLVSEVAGPTPVVLALVRGAGPVDDTDRALHETALALCRVLGIRLLSTWVDADGDLHRLPVAGEERGVA